MRKKITDFFDEYTSNYNIEDPKIRLKVEHTYRVADLTDTIVKSIEDKYIITPLEAQTAWIIGMLHDIGRFEQVRRYNTFWDADSVDHAQFGADLLFGSKANNSSDKQIELGFELPNAELIELAIRNHNKYKLPEGLTDRELLFSNIIRDADKIDILKVNLDFSIEEIYGVTEEELLKTDITDEVLEAALCGHAVDRALRKTHMDTVVSHASMM